MSENTSLRLNEEKPHRVNPCLIFINFSVDAKNMHPSINRSDVAYLIEKCADNEGADFLKNC